MTSTDNRGSEERFDNRQAQVVGALCSALFALIGISMVVQPSSRWSGSFFFLFGVLSGVRFLRSSTVVVDDSGVTTRSIVRTRRYAFSDLRVVEVAVGQTGLNGFGRQYLVFHRKDGANVAFKELNCPPPKQADATSVVLRAAASIRQRTWPADDGGRCLDAKD